MNELRKLQQELEALKAERWNNATVEEKLDMLRDDIRDINTNIKFQERQKTSIAEIMSYL